MKCIHCQNEDSTCTCDLADHLPTDPHPTVPNAKVTMLARMLVVAYWLGWKHGSKGNSDPIPTTLNDMMGKGHDGLDWQKFVPLAKDILEKISKF